MKKIKEKIENKENENEINKRKKKNGNGNNNDSFINELTNILINVNKIEENKQNEKNKSIDNDKEPDSRINFEQIQRINLLRPQTSYDGLNTKKKKSSKCFTKLQI